MTTKTLTITITAALTSVLLLVVTAGGILTGGAALACTASPATTGPTPTPLSASTGPPTGWPATGTPAAQIIECPDQNVLIRAATWLTAWNGGPVPYSMSTNSTAWFDGYRRDCSGYASMALDLPRPGLTTSGLAARSTPIPKTALQAGDLLINPSPGGSGHVVIFDHWVDPGAMTQYVGYEQSGDGGTHHRVIEYPYFGAYPMSPFHFVVG
jgi:hypothetical protein